MYIQISLRFRHEVDLDHLPEDIKEEIRKALAEAFLAKLRSFQEEEQSRE